MAPFMTLAPGVPIGEGDGKKFGEAAGVGKAPNAGAVPGNAVLGVIGEATGGVANRPTPTGATFGARVAVLNMGLPVGVRGDRGPLEACSWFMEGALEGLALGCEMRRLSRLIFKEPALLQVVPSCRNNR